jgi:TetR/AcrR family transcriptional regulator, acrAB operon repressor
MPRRTKEVAENTRERIIEAAIRLFNIKGVSRTTLEQIASEAGFTRGAVYHNFANKEALLFDLVKRVRPPTEEILAALESSGKENLMDSLKSAIIRSLERTLNDPGKAAIHTVFMHNCEFVETSNPMFGQDRTYLNATLKAITLVFEQAHELGQIRSSLVPSELAGSLLSYCYGILALTLRMRLTQDNLPICSIEESMDHFFRGLSTSP